MGVQSCLQPWGVTVQRPTVAQSDTGMEKNEKVEKTQRSRLGQLSGHSAGGS